MGDGIVEVSESEFETQVLDAKVPVVVDFWAPWCGPCRVVAPEFEKLASTVGVRAKFVKMNIDENREIAVRFGVMSIPTIAKFERGAVTAQVVGARRADDLGQGTRAGVSHRCRRTT
ncbi:MAG: thioredoxin [Coriobacteriaceae bacterium]|nr:thioredoxin [Coriobacteriaceae bacterium]